MAFFNLIQMKIIYTLLFIILLSSCAFNKMFLYPFELTNDATFKEYKEEVKDTIQLSFNSKHQPILKNNKTQDAGLKYKIIGKDFINSNGDSINAWLIKPNSYNGTTIYYLHGNAGNIVYNFPLMESFANHDYQIFMIDYSGFGFSQGKAKRKNVLIDGNDGLNFLLNSPEIKYDKLIIYGQSLGGHLACVVATQNENMIDALVVEGAFSSHKDIANDVVPFLGRILVREMYSAEKSLPDFHKPVLIIHSKEDKTVVYKNGEQLFKVANEPKKFLSIKGRHVFGPILYFDTIANEITKMLK